MKQVVSGTYTVDCAVTYSDGSVWDGIASVLTGSGDIDWEPTSVVSAGNSGDDDGKVRAGLLRLCRDARADPDRYGVDRRRAAPGGECQPSVVPGPAEPPCGRITTMTETPDMNDVAAAALRLIGAFEHGHSVGALEAVLVADPLVIATALGLLAARSHSRCDALPAVRPCRPSTIPSRLSVQGCTWSANSLSPDR